MDLEGFFKGAVPDPVYLEILLPGEMNSATNIQLRNVYQLTNGLINSALDTVRLEYELEVNRGLYVTDVKPNEDTKDAIQKYANCVRALFVEAKEAGIVPLELPQPLLDRLYFLDIAWPRPGDDLEQINQDEALGNQAEGVHGLPLHEGMEDQLAQDAPPPPVTWDDRFPTPAQPNPPRRLEEPLRIRRRRCWDKDALVPNDVPPAAQRLEEPRIRRRSGFAKEAPPVLNDAPPAEQRQEKPLRARRRSRRGKDVQNDEPPVQQARHVPRCLLPLLVVFIAFAVSALEWWYLG